MNQDHHRDPTLILLLAPRTPTCSSLQGSHVGKGDPCQLARPSPLRDGVPLFSAPRRPMTNGLIRVSWPRGYKCPEWWLGQWGRRLDPRMGRAGWPGLTSLCRPAWAHRPGPTSAQLPVSFAWRQFPSLLDPSPFCMWLLSSVSLRVGWSSLSYKIQHFSD
jgi:hypothetical protein